MPDDIRPTVLYFGCRRGVKGDHQEGHHFYDARLRSSSISAARIPWRQVDGALAPREGREEKAQGVAALHHLDGWTALSFWDRTGDERGNSSSTFFIDRELPFDEALAVARETFPALFARFKRYGLEVVPDAS